MDCKTAQQKIMPYIERRLSDREAEDFIDHVRGCRACSEELEVYFTIYYALKQLDDGQDSFDIKELLERDLQQTENRIKRHDIMHFYQRLAAALAAVLGGILLITLVQFFWFGTFEKTTIYNLFSNETEAAVQSETPESAQTVPTEEREPETNQKRQFIVTTPETEAREPISELAE